MSVVVRHHFNGAFAVGTRQLNATIRLTGGCDRKIWRDRTPRLCRRIAPLELSKLPLSPLIALQTQVRTNSWGKGRANAIRPYEQKRPKPSW